MNTQQINLVASIDPCLRREFVGVFASDKLPNDLPQQPEVSIVCNTDPSWQAGRHWVAVHLAGETGEFFDSYGLPPTGVFEDFMNKQACQWVYSNKRLQGGFSTVCGQYCIFYLWHKCRGFSISDILGMFKDDYHTNDMFVNQFVSECFNVKIMEQPFIIGQICKELTTV